MEEQLNQVFPSPVRRRFRQREVWACTRSNHGRAGEGRDAARRAVGWNWCWETRVQL
jgi:hypothetical protein